MNALRQLQQCRTRRIDHRRFRRLDQAGISFNCIAGSKLLNHRRFCPDVFGRKIRRTEFVEFRGINANRVSVNRRPLQMRRERHDHARVNATGKVGPDRNVRPQALVYRLEHHLLKILD